MLKRELSTHYSVAAIWLVLVTLLRWLTRGYPAWSPLVTIVSFWLGGLIGTFFLDIDHLIYTFVIYPQELTSLRVKRLLSQHKIKETLILLADTHEERNKLSFHNALFQPIFFVFCFWILTSTNSWFGKGLVMAIALHLLKDEIELLVLGREEHLRSWLFWQIKREISFQAQKAFVIVMFLVFLGLNLLLV